MRKFLKVMAVGICGLGLLTGGVATAQDTPVTGASAEAAVGTAFVFQGALRNATGPVTGSCDFTFAPYGQVSGGQAVGPLLTRNGVQVTNGIFSVTLDFTASPFTGNERWLEIAVRCPAGVGAFSTLAPRQPVLAVPYALYAQAAATAQRATGASGDFTVTSGVLKSSVAPGNAEVAGALLLENATSGNSWSLAVRKAEADKLAIDGWDAALRTWRYGLRLDRESNLSIGGNLTAQDVLANNVRASGGLESARASDGDNAGTLILTNLSSGNRWYVPIRSENGDSLDFYFWDAAKEQWRRPLRVENNGKVVVQQSSATNTTLLELTHPGISMLFHVDPTNHAEIAVYDPTTNTTRWDLIDIDRSTGHVGIGGNGSPDYDLIVHGVATVYTDNQGSGNLLELHHPKVQTYFHVDAEGHPELGLKNIGTGGSVWNVLDIDPATGHIGIGNTAAAGNRLTVYGNFSATGTKAATVDTGAYGLRKLYATEAADVRFSDEGLAQLHNGVARVDLDPIFAATIVQPYIIQLTPYADAALYVAEVGDGYFVVKAHAGDGEAQFAWRLSAPRQGYAGVRLEQVADTTEGDAP